MAYILNTPFPITHLDTPALIADLDEMTRNIKEMQYQIDLLGLTLRPHTKAHKIPALAQMQIDAGAVGICTSKLGEAEVMVKGGIRDVLITTPIAGAAKYRRLIDLCKEHPKTVIRQVIDHPEHVKTIARLATEAGIEVGVLVEVESGQMRCGVLPDESLVQLIELINRTEGVRYDGIQAYSGHLQLVKGYQVRLQAAFDAVRDVFAFIDTTLAPRGLKPGIVSGGGTGTFAAYLGLGYTEIQSGSYIFMDATYAAIGDELCDVTNRQFSPALNVLTTVISHPAANRAVVDAGMKSLSIDLGMPKVLTYPEVTYQCGGDEHGILHLPEGHQQLKVGEVLTMLPSHCDTTLHNFDVLYGVRDGMVVEQWAIEGRGRSD